MTELPGQGYTPLEYGTTMGTAWKLLPVGSCFAYAQ